MGAIFTSEAEETQDRRLKYGEERAFERDAGAINARKIENYAENNLYADTGIKVSKTTLRKINSQISKAKEAMGISDICTIPIVVSENNRSIASYNPRTDVIFISPKFGNEKAVKDMQEGFACPDNPISTIVHELYHWQDAHEYRQGGGIIANADDMEKYTAWIRDVAFEQLKKWGYDLDNILATKEKISDYASNAHRNNNFEEMNAEARTKKLLEG